MPDDLHESALSAHGPVAGVDEAGRGPLAGPVVAAAVIFDPARLPAGLDDSKRLTQARREALAAALVAQAETGIGIASVEEIDRLNILQASHLAMCRALAALPRPPAHALIDGNLVPKECPCLATAVIGGDARSVSIAAASIIAKVTRDRIMRDLAQHFPGYGWETNMGYPSKSHRSALQTLGVTPHHRRSFAPVRNILYQAHLPSA
ncbi:ribonuclease HII [Roseivivax isoporae]|uniref:Ribonuclease HII n=1 Tax=Roseivivax isoporae LMG 25204 TaxID=1449351 RepID=X7FDS1_9RHOB|nr:ribonuclease HII [Roseivivax isoporae]ETX30199.1 ribonuclease HII [Roseivivax isoporae LMG 25204]